MLGIGKLNAYSYYQSQSVDRDSESQTSKFETQPSAPHERYIFNPPDPYELAKYMCDIISQDNAHLFENILSFYVKDINFNAHLYLNTLKAADWYRNQIQPLENAAFRNIVEKNDIETHIVKVSRLTGTLIKSSVVNLHFPSYCESIEQITTFVFNELIAHARDVTSFIKQFTPSNTQLTQTAHGIRYRGILEFTQKDRTSVKFKVDIDNIDNFTEGKEIINNTITTFFSSLINKTMQLIYDFKILEEIVFSHYVNIDNNLSKYKEVQSQYCNIIDNMTTINDKVATRTNEVLQLSDEFRPNIFNKVISDTVSFKGKINSILHHINYSDDCDFSLQIFLERTLDTDALTTCENTMHELIMQRTYFLNQTQELHKKIILNLDTYITELINYFESLKIYSSFGFIISPHFDEEVHRQYLLLTNSFSKPILPSEVLRDNIFNVINELKLKYNNYTPEDIPADTRIISSKRILHLFNSWRECFSSLITHSYQYLYVLHATEVLQKSMIHYKTSSEVLNLNTPNFVSVGSAQSRYIITTVARSMLHLFNSHRICKDVWEQFLIAREQHPQHVRALSSLTQQLFDLRAQCDFSNPFTIESGLYHMINQKLTNLHSQTKPAYLILTDGESTTALDILLDHCHILVCECHDILAKIQLAVPSRYMTDIEKNRFVYNFLDRMTSHALYQKADEFSIHPGDFTLVSSSKVAVAGESTSIRDDSNPQKFFAGFVTDFYKFLADN